MSIQNQDLFLQRLKSGEEDAFRELVKTLGPRLLRTAEHLLADQAEAQDCLQETFLQVHQKIDTYRGEASLATWVHRILVNSCLMKLRGRNRSNASLETLHSEFDSNCRLEPIWQFQQTVEEIVMQQDTREKVARHIKQLPDGYRETLILRDIEGYTTAEVCEMLSLSSSTVKVRLHRARAALKKTLEPYLEGFYP